MDALADAPEPTTSERQQRADEGRDGYYREQDDAKDDGDFGGRRVGAAQPDGATALAEPVAEAPADPAPAAGWATVPAATPEEPAADLDATDGIVDTGALAGEDEISLDLVGAYDDEEDDGGYDRYDRDDRFRTVEEAEESERSRELASPEREARKARAESVTRGAGRRTSDKREERSGWGPGKAKKSAEAPPPDDASVAFEADEDADAGAGTGAPVEDVVAQATEADREVRSSGSARWTLQTTNDQVLAQLDTLCDGTAAVSCRFVSGGTGASATGDDASDPVVTVELSRGAYDSWKRALGKLGALRISAESLEGLPDDAPVILSLTVQIRP